MTTLINGDSSCRVNGESSISSLYFETVLFYSYFGLSRDLFKHLEIILICRDYV